MASFTKGGKWKVIKDLKGFPTHDGGGVDLVIGSDGVKVRNGNSEFHAANGLVMGPGDPPKKKPITLPVVTVNGNVTFTEDPNDPRLKMYRDSMSLYQNSIKSDNQFFNKFKDAINATGDDLNNNFITEEELKNRPDWAAAIKKRYPNAIKNIDVFKRQYDKKGDFLSLNPNTTNKSIKPVYSKSYGWFSPNAWLDGAGGSAFTHVDMYKKPTNPVILGKPRDPDAVSPLPMNNEVDSGLKLPDIKTPPAKKSLLNSGEYAIDYENIPNIKVIYKRVNGAVVPTDYMNAIGERIPYGTPLNRAFQYPDMEIKKKK